MHARVRVETQVPTHSRQLRPAGNGLLNEVGANGVLLEGIGDQASGSIGTSAGGGSYSGGGGIGINAGLSRKIGGGLAIYGGQ